MARSPRGGVGTLLYLVLITWLDRAQVQIHGVLASGEKRYYHHEVHLDGSKHNDEFFSFVTRPDLDAPRWDIDVSRDDLVAPGYWFSAPYSDVAQSKADAPWNAPHIYDGNGDLVWSGAPVFDGFTTFDFRVTNVQGRQMLSLVYPRGGKAIIFDDAYRIHKIVDMGDEVLQEDQIGLNSHEFTTAEDGTKALYMTRLPKSTSEENTATVGWDGKCFAIFDGVQELDTETWESANTWSSEGLIGLDESYADKGPIANRCSGKEAWDFFHANSIDSFENGDYLVSGRRTNAVYRISRKDGSILWRLGGRKSDFAMPTVFSGQHAAKIHHENDTGIVISLLDNAFLPPARQQTTNSESRGLLLELDITTMEAKVLAEYPHPEGKYATSRGNMHMLPNDNAWICWADGSLQSEHSINGSLIMKARFKARISSYRTYKFPWIGRPDYPPDVHAAVVDKNGQWYTIVHMSWNGATEIRQWAIYHTDSNGDERKLMAKIPKRGFETSAWTEGYATHVVAKALDENGDALGESHVFNSLPPRTQSNSITSDDRPESRGSSLQGESAVAFIVFASGIAIGVTVGLLLSTPLKRNGMSQCFRSFVLWGSGKEQYEPLITRREEDDAVPDQLNDDLQPYTVGGPNEDKSIQ